MEGNAQAAASPPRVARACDGDVEALYRDHRLPVLKLTYVLSGSWQVAEEVTQESFLRLLDAWDRDQIANPAGWVRTVAANLARSRVRRLSAEVRAIARLSGQRREPAVLDTAGVEAEAFWAQVRTLPARQAQAVALHYLEDRPVVEVADLMGVAEGTAKALLHQGRRRLANLLDLDEEADA